MDTFRRHEGVPRMSKPSDEHQFYLNYPFKIQYGLKLFDHDEKAILERYGSLYLALMNNLTQPETAEQEHLVLVCQGKAGVATRHEYIWKLWMSARDQERDISQSPFNKGAIEPPVPTKWEPRPPYTAPISPYYTSPPRAPSKLKGPENPSPQQSSTLLGSHHAVNKPSSAPTISRPSEKTTPQTDERFSRSICPLCSGDGGGGGRCYKCDGTGFV